MSVFVLDTNIISYYLKGDEQVVGRMRAAVASGNRVLVAPIAYYEIKRGLAAVNSQRSLHEFEALCATLGVGLLDNSILDLSAAIWVEQRKAGRASEDADIFIAAFCISHGFTLVTHNTKHFEAISDLALTDWME
jgi:predicted nucleic acid-binding protein